MYDDVIRVKSTILVRVIRVNMVTPQAVSFDVRAYPLNLTHTTTSHVPRISDLTAPWSESGRHGDPGNEFELSLELKHWESILLLVLGPNQLY